MGWDEREFTFSRANAWMTGFWTVQKRCRRRIPAVAPPNLPFYLPTPPNISHLKCDVLDHHVNLGGDGATKCIVAMHRHQYISQVSFKSCCIGPTVRANENAPSHRTNTSQKCRHNASTLALDRMEPMELGLFPSFIITASSLKNVCRVVHYLFYVFPIQRPPMV